MRNNFRGKVRELDAVVRGIRELVGEVAAALNAASLTGSSARGLLRVLRLALYDLAALARAFGGESILIHEKHVNELTLYIPCIRGCKPFAELSSVDGCVRAVYGCVCETGLKEEGVVEACQSDRDNT